MKKINHRRLQKLKQRAKENFKLEVAAVYEKLGVQQPVTKVF